MKEFRSGCIAIGLAYCRPEILAIAQRRELEAREREIHETFERKIRAFAMFSIAVSLCVVAYIVFKW